MATVPDISVRGASPAIRYLLREAVNKLSTQLMSRRLARTLTIQVKFIRGLRKREGVFATIDYMDEYFYRTPRTYTIMIDQRWVNSPVRLLLLVAHEMIHVQQIASGTYKHLRAGIKYNGKLYSHNLDYKEQPWENDAFGGERAVLRRLLDETKLLERYYETHQVPVRVRDCEESRLASPELRSDSADCRAVSV